MILLALTTEEVLTAYGPLGVISAFGLYFFRATVNRLIAERNLERDRANSLINETMNKVIPLVERATEVLKGRQKIDEETLDVLKDVRRLLEQNK